MGSFMTQWLMSVLYMWYLATTCHNPLGLRTKHTSQLLADSCRQGMQRFIVMQKSSWPNSIILCLDCLGCNKQIESPTGTRQNRKRTNYTSHLRKCPSQKLQKNCGDSHQGPYHSTQQRSQTFTNPAEKQPFSTTKPLKNAIFLGHGAFNSLSND